jgi:hypothetical protein
MVLVSWKLQLGGGCERYVLMAQNQEGRAISEWTYGRDDWSRKRE